MAETEDWLPPGWTVEVKIRNNGKRDKYYHAPLDGPKFNSKPEVSRYLQISDHNTKERNKGTFKRSKRNVVVEKVIPKGLPPGWIKEIRVTKKARKIRRDPYYIDPISGKIFRSMKDVYRYLETEELGSLGKQLKGSSRKDLDYDETSSPTVSKEQKLAVGKTRRQIDFDQSSDLNKILKDEQIPNSTFTGQCQFLLEHTSDQGGVSNELRNSDLQEAKVSEKALQSNSPKSTLASFPAGEVLQGEQSPECVLTKHESGRTRLGLSKSKAKKETNLPRRASKRLAGLEVDPIPELKPITRARRSAVKQSGDGVNHAGSSSTPGSDCTFQHSDQLEIKPETYCTVDTSKSTELLLQSNKRRCLPVDLVTPEKQVVKAETGINCDNSTDEKLELPLDLPLGELLTDPCIAFAIKTLTGVGFDTSKSSEVASAGSNSSEHSSGNLATPMELAGNAEKGKEVERELRPPTVVLPPRVLSFPERRAGKVDTDNNADEKSGYPIEFPSSCSWLDPCIEFAIKTLTADAIPDIQNYFQQQPSSSNSQEHSGELSMKNVGLDKSSQSNVLHPQFCDVEKPVLEQQVLVEHTLLPPSRTINIPNPCGSSQNHHGQGRH